MRKKTLDIEARNKAIVYLYHVENKSLRDIALMFDISRQAVLKVIKKTEA